MRILILCFLALCVAGRVIDFESLGAIADDSSLETEWANGALLNSTWNKLQPGDTFVISNKTFHVMGGILVTQDVIDVTFDIQGTLSFSDDRVQWPRTQDTGHVLEAIQFSYLQDVTFTSSGSPDNRGTLNGNGAVWWGAINFLHHQEDRPRLISVSKSQNVLFERILLKDSAFWTFWFQNCEGLEVRYSEIDARRDQADKHTKWDLTAFNTDGYDITGNNVYIHHVKIWNDDDCISVKDGSTNMLFEHIEASGLGLVIGSIGSSRVDNITFRHAVMQESVKGIYMKTRWRDDGPIGSAASISRILYENITIISPTQFAIWIGPAQQTGQPCSLLWPHGSATCSMSGYQTWSDIVLKDITIIDPRHSPGVLMGNSSNPITGLVFDNVQVKYEKERIGQRMPWGNVYMPCEGIVGSTQGSDPAPQCLQAQ